MHVNYTENARKAIRKFAERGSHGPTSEQKHAIAIKGLVLRRQIASVCAGFSDARNSQQTEPLLAIAQSSASPWVTQKTLWIQCVAEF